MKQKQKNHNLYLRLVTRTIIVHKPWKYLGISYLEYKYYLKRPDYYL